MSVEIELSSAFAMFTNDVLNVSTEGKTVREALCDLVTQFPKLQKMLLNTNGDLQQTYDYFINGQSVFPRDMSRPLKDGDKLNVLYLIHGG
jgi:molybdopterin converting factor small subunit